MLIVFSPIFVADTKITFLYNFVASLIKSKVQIKTRNATRCNKCHDLLHLSFTLKISVFLEAYIKPSRTSVMELLLRKQQAVKYIHKKASSQLLAWVLNKPLLSEEEFYYFKVLYIRRLLKYVRSLGSRNLGCNNMEVQQFFILMVVN